VNCDLRAGRARFSVDVDAARSTEQFELTGAVTSDALRDAFAAISANLSQIEIR
jgi:hypothetical protein